MVPYGTVLLGVTSLGVGAVGDVTGETAWTHENAQSAARGFATSDAVEREGFEGKRVWFDEKNGSSVVLETETAEREQSQPARQYVGWRVVEAGVDSALEAASDEVTTVFLAEGLSVEAESRDALYRFSDVGTLVGGRFSRQNGNDTTERFYSVGVVPVRKRK